MYLVSFGWAGVFLAYAGFLSCCKLGPSGVVLWLLIAATSCCRAQALGTQASVVVAYGLNSWSSQALERGLSSWGAWA